MSLLIINIYKYIFIYNYNMENLFVVVCNDSTWEDIAIILTEKEAIEESIKHPNIRIEIFKNVDSKYKQIIIKMEN